MICDMNYLGHLNNRVAPACLPSRRDFVDVEAIVSGWGTAFSDGSQSSALHAVTMETMSNAGCKRDLGSTVKSTPA